MTVVAKLKGAPLSAQKCRLVANQIRGLSVDKALQLLTFSVRKAAKLIKKILESAIANAEHNQGANIDDLRIALIFVDEARVSKRFRARAKGRANRIIKRSCHITVAVAENEE